MNENKMKPEDCYLTLPAALTVPQLAETLQIGRNQAYEMVNTGVIRSLRIGRTIRIPKSGLIDYLENTS